MHSAFQNKTFSTEDARGFDMAGCRFFAVVLLIFFGFLTPRPSLAARVVLSCGSIGKELEACRTSAEEWAQKTGNQVQVVASPGAAGERLAQYQLLLAAGGSDIDIFLIDTTWPGMLGDFFVDLNTSAEIRAATAHYFPAFIKNNTVHGKLVALPWFVDAGVLYYRRDLLKKYHEKVPETWDELTSSARKIQDGERAHGNPKFWGYVFQGRAYEGLTCNALEWIVSNGGGEIVDSSGQVTVDNPNAIGALSTAASWFNAKDPIAPRGVLNYMEEEARGVFQSGDAAFMRNWPYAMKLANSADSPVRGKVGMTLLPEGSGADRKHASTLGGWSLAVSRYSKNKNVAMSLVAWLARPQEQKHRALMLGENPTIMSLYKDPVLLKDNPYFKTLLEVFKSAVPRPAQQTGTKYNRVSAEFWDSVHRVLSGEATPAVALRKLKTKLELIGRKGKW
jgi:trehalose/maltose transport system substrate-binding protein